MNGEKTQQFNGGISKSVTLDFSWGEFVRLLEYKLEERGKYLIKVDRFFPSSKKCSTCGYINKTLRLSDRTWVCPSCSATHDRDTNAAHNLFVEGCRLLTTHHHCTVDTTGTYACGEVVIPLRFL